MWRCSTRKKSFTVCRPGGIQRIDRCDLGAPPLHVVPEVDPRALQPDDQVQVCQPSSAVLRLGSMRQRPAKAGFAAHAASGSATIAPRTFQSVAFIARTMNSLPALND
jgi:hypothetical protein